MATVRLTVAPGGAVRVPRGALPSRAEVPWNAAGAVGGNVYANGCACAYNMAAGALATLLVLSMAPSTPMAVRVRAYSGYACPTQGLYIQ